MRSRNPLRNLGTVTTSPRIQPSTSRFAANPPPFTGVSPVFNGNRRVRGLLTQLECAASSAANTGDGVAGKSTKDGVVYPCVGSAFTLTL